MIKKLFWFVAVICGLLIVLAYIPCKKAKKSHVAESSVVINLSPARTWQKLSDLTLAHYYVPGLVKTQITTAQQKGLGASRRVYQSKKHYINETVIDWHEGHGFTVKLHNDDGTAPFPFTEAVFTYTMEAISPQQVKITTSLHYRIGMGCLGHWLHDRVLAPMFKKRISKVATNLKRFYETGKPVGQGSENVTAS